MGNEVERLYGIMNTTHDPDGYQEKVWGQTKCVYESPFCSEHHLIVKAGGYCSFHYHRHRANRFIVKSGVVKVVWCYGIGVRGVILTADMKLDINSLVPHQFQVLEEGEMIEQYFSDRGGVVENDDIVRHSQGGLVPKGWEEWSKKDGIVVEDHLMSFLFVREE